MSKAVSNTDLVAYTKALEAAGIAIKLVSRVPAPLETFDQVRAMTWRLLNPM